MKKVLCIICMCFFTLFASQDSVEVTQNTSKKDICELYPEDYSCLTPNFDFRFAEQNALKHFEIFDSNGRYVGPANGYTADEAMRYSKLRPGLYILKNKGKWKIYIK